MLNVFLTIDTEIWPHAAGWPVKPLPPSKSDFSAEIAGYIQGETRRGDYGVPYQMDVLNRHGLRATYFVEPLFARKAGAGRLRELVALIQDAGQEVQLHLHTEWLSEIEDPGLPPRYRQHIRQFAEDDQARIIGTGADDLRQAGARQVCAFRAGNFGANWETLRALARNGLRYDSSHNACHLDDACHLRSDAPLRQQAEIGGVYEFPVSVFSDYPGHLRPAQLCACSFEEMRGALLRAWKAGWYSFVVVWHGFELLRHVRSPERRTPDWINIRRFEKLCAFLDANRDRFNTTLFSEIDPATVPRGDSAPPLRSPLRRTAWRLAEQAVSRLL